MGLSEAQSLGLTYTVGNQVFLGVDNTTVIPSASGNGKNGRKSIWLESKNSFLHGILIGDFAHMPGSDWPLARFVSTLMLSIFFIANQISKLDDPQWGRLIR